MEKGSMRLEPNISLREVGSGKLEVGKMKLEMRGENLPNYKVEVKNNGKSRSTGRVGKDS